jgi:hypothetical protein
MSIIFFLSLPFALQEFDACQRLKFNVQMVDLHNDPSCGSISTALRFPDAAEFHPLM